MLITCVKSNDTPNTVEDLKFTGILQTDLNCYIAPPGFLVLKYPIGKPEYSDLNDCLLRKMVMVVMESFTLRILLYPQDDSVYPGMVLFTGFLMTSHFNVNKRAHNQTKTLSRLLIDIFIDEDGALIECLLFILHIYVNLDANKFSMLLQPSACRQMPPLPKSIHPDIMFHEFLVSTGHDYQVLLDLLVNNETCFLLYLLMFLKFKKSLIDESHKDRRYNSGEETSEGLISNLDQNKGNEFQKLVRYCDETDSFLEIFMLRKDEDKASIQNLSGNGTFLKDVSFRDVSCSSKINEDRDSYFQTHQSNKTLNVEKQFVTNKYLFTESVVTDSKDQMDLIKSKILQNISLDTLKKDITNSFEINMSKESGGSAQDSGCSEHSQKNVEPYRVKKKGNILNQDIFHLTKMSKCEIQFGENINEKIKEMTWIDSELQDPNKRSEEKSVQLFEVSSNNCYPSTSSCDLNCSWFRESSLSKAALEYLKSVKSSEKSYKVNCYDDSRCVHHPSNNKLATTLTLNPQTAKSLLSESGLHRSTGRISCKTSNMKSQSEQEKIENVSCNANNSEVNAPQRLSKLSSNDVQDKSRLECTRLVEYGDNNAYTDNTSSINKVLTDLSLSISKLNRAKLFPYNPNALLRLLNFVTGSQGSCK